MSQQFGLTGMNVLRDRITKLATLAKLDATPLMRSWMRIIDDDNRLGILAGTDKDGVPMMPVTYRPVPAPGHRVTRPPKGKSQAALRNELHRFRRFQRPGLRKGVFAGLTGVGADSVERNNNLKTSQYRLLAGPPLAPRDQFSRVITNLKLSFVSPNHGASRWAAIGAWDEIVDQEGRPFLFYHFNGIGQKRRDLRGVRPNGVAKAYLALRNWARLAIREHFGHEVGA